LAILQYGRRSKGKAVGQDEGSTHILESKEKPLYVTAWNTQADYGHLILLFYHLPFAALMDECGMTALPRFRGKMQGYCMLLHAAEVVHERMDA